ncbi:MAG: sulfite exporter TauE/SafE family protein [Candidatus Sericytochromatia bacterium]|nr:sulfite exporter TauE/SafE family protein [Candidatus Sericytochromatia bacterium]
MAQSTTEKTKKPLPLPLLGFGLLFGLLLSLGLIAVFQPLWLEHLLGSIESWYGGLLENQAGTHPLLLMGFAFLGGVLGSISPCILAMLPMNLGYIGTLNIESRLDALRKAGAFVLGVVLINSLFGLASGFAQAVMMTWRGYLFISVGLLILVMAAAMLEWIHLPLPTVVKRVPSSGPFVVGSAFALISSPCASPVLFGVLAMAATSGNMAWSVATMAAYGLGYSALIFLASLFTGLSKQVSGLKYHGAIITRLSGSVLFLAGLWALYEGIKWFLA